MSARPMSMFSFHSCAIEQQAVVINALSHNAVVCPAVPAVPLSAGFVIKAGRQTHVRKCMLFPTYAVMQQSVMINALWTCHSHAYCPTCAVQQQAVRKSTTKVPLKM